MKVFALLAASALAVVSAQTPPDCDVAKLGLILVSPDGTSCQGNTGFSVLELKFPEGETLKKVCTEPSCKPFLTAMTAAVPTECIVRNTPVKSTLIDKFLPACAALEGSSTPAPGPTTVAPGPTTAPGSTTKAPDATTKAPEGTTAAPDATTKAPETTTAAPEATTAAPADGSEEAEAGSGSSTDIDDLETATTAPTTKPAVPTPAPTKSSASSIVAATGAVAVAVAASFF